MARSGTLRLLEGTAINCLVVDGSAGDLQPIIAEARKRGLVVVGPGEPSVAWLSRADVARRSTSPVLALTDNVWPSIRLSANGDEGAVDAGPTGVPWIDSNGWFVQLARTVAPKKAVWIVAEPPGPKVVRPVESYSAAVADAAAWGGRWVVSLDTRLRAELAARKPQALLAWRNIARMLAFFETHKDWRAWQSMAVLAVLSDFAGPNEFFSMKALNLIVRRQLPLRIMDKTQPGAWSLDGLKAVIYVDHDAPAPVIREKLLLRGWAACWSAHLGALTWSLASRLRMRSTRSSVYTSSRKDRWPSQRWISPIHTSSPQMPISFSAGATT